MYKRIVLAVDLAEAGPNSEGARTSAGAGEGERPAN